MPLSIEDLIVQVSANKFTEAELNISDIPCTAADVIRLAEALKKNPHIIHLDVSYITMSDEATRALAEVKSLESLCMVECEIGKEGAAILAASHLKKLILTHNPIHNDAIPPFQANSSIIELDLSECDMTGDGAAPLFKNKVLKKLNLNSQEITDESLKFIAENHTLEELNVSNNQLTKQAAVYLRDNHSLKILIISDNTIEDEGAIELAKHATLERLQLSQNSVGDEGAIALSQHGKIKKLVLFNNNITTIGANALAQNKILESLNVSFNKIDAEGIQNLQKREWTELDYSLNPGTHKLSDPKKRKREENSLLQSLAESGSPIHTSRSQAPDSSPDINQTSNSIHQKKST